mgnify:CR=1 FL=1
MESQENPPLLRAMVNSVQLAYKDQGSGIPILCIHGSWDDHHSWDGVAAILRQEFRVISYDRRGHSASTAPPGQGHLCDDVSDALALINELGLSSAHIVGHSYGANVAVALAGQFPADTQSLFVHEPPLFSLLNADSELEQLRSFAAERMQRAADLIKSGQIENAARLFIEEVAFGEGSWETLFSHSDRRTILANADTWLDQFQDPQRLAVDVTRLQAYPHRITLSGGSASLPCYRAVNRLISHLLPKAFTVTIEGGAHGAHLSHPQAVADAIRSHVNSAPGTAQQYTEVH